MVEKEVNNFILLINGPIRKFCKQLCDCSDSFCTDYSEFVGNATIRTTYNVCSVCQKSYHVEYDTSNITMIKNIGDSDAERQETPNS